MSASAITPIPIGPLPINSSSQEKHEPIKKTKKYTATKVWRVRILYCIAIVLWLIIIYALGLYKYGIWGNLILCIPIVAYGIAIFNASSLTVEVEEATYSVSYLSIAMLVVIPLSISMNKAYNGDKREFTLILVVAVVLGMLSLIDIYTRPKWLSVTRHAKSALQTASVVLLTFALFAYYMGHKVK